MLVRTRRHVCLSLTNASFPLPRSTDNFHQFCRLLARFKTNFQLSELVKIEGYSDCIQHSAMFTIQSLQHWQWAANSIHYLLALWERMITSMPYVVSDQPHYIDKYCPQITEAYIQSRINSVEMVVRDGLEDPLDSIEDILSQVGFGRKEKEREKKKKKKKKKRKRKRKKEYGKGIGEG